MPILAPQQVLNLLQQHQYAPLYFLQGEETYYIDLITAHLEQQVLSEAEKTFNLTVLYGRDHTMGNVIRQAQQYPIMGERQVVIVKEAQDLADINRESGQTALINYISTPNSTTLLAFAYKHKTLATNSKLSKMLTEYAILVHAKTLYENQIPTWIRGYATEQQVVMTDQAILLLQELVGSDLGRLAKEMDKIILNLHPRDTITDEDIQEYVGMSKQFNAFELQNAIATKDVFKAYQLVFQLASHTRSPIAIPVVSLLFTFFSKILLLHQAADRSSQGLAQVLQVNSYFVPQYVAAAKLYPVSKIIQNINHLQAADMQLKGVGYPFVGEGEILQELVYKLLH
jgi:DNA polymerase III subunit delta